jgi:hypothetical protein
LLQRGGRGSENPEDRVTYYVHVPLLEKKSSSNIDKKTSAKSITSNERKILHMTYIILKLKKRRSISTTFKESIFRQKFS